MIQRLIPFFCLFHILAILWWALPKSFADVQAAKDFNPTAIFDWEMPLLNATRLSDNHPLNSVFSFYINLTGTQQYWDFFAPSVPKFHQYLSICNDLIKIPQQGKIICKAPALFSHFNNEFNNLNLVGVAESRFYRLTENLAALDNPELFTALSHYYQKQNAVQPILVLHQFELAPDLPGLPTYGYQMDKQLFPATE
jgi:hypothetical protein